MPFFKEMALSGNMDKSVFHSFSLSIGNTLMIANEFTDEEAEEFRTMLIALDPGSLRNYLMSKNVIFCETFSYLNNVEHDIWKVMNQRIDVGSRSVELFCIKTDELQDMIGEFLIKKIDDEENFTFHDFLPQGTMSTITPKGNRWRYSIFVNNVSEESGMYLISVVEQY
ncbi:hypothetical protein C4565_02665 [Candidatus Parcubacteria bacterium]|jgi:hypothetical protein|nr:MAG: hypothetical protein C4565_02665 [Candidatus Parcubacteria bacterium]